MKRLYYFGFYVILAQITAGCQRNATQHKQLSIGHGINGVSDIGYNKQNIILGVNEEDIDTMYIKDSLFKGEKYFLSDEFNSLVSMNVSPAIAFLYELKLNEKNPKDIFHDHVGSIIKGQYKSTRKIDGRYIQQNYKLTYDSDDGHLLIRDHQETLPRQYREIDRLEYRRITAGFLETFVFPSLSSDLDSIPYRLGFVNINIPLWVIDTDQRKMVESTKGISYLDYYFLGKINQQGYAYDISSEYFNDKIPNNQKIVDDIILDYIAAQQFLIATFNNLPANYVLRIRTTFID